MDQVARLDPAEDGNGLGRRRPRQSDRGVRQRRFHRHRSSMPASYIQRGDIVLPFTERPAPPLKSEANFDHFAPANGKAMAMVITGKNFQAASRQRGHRLRQSGQRAGREGRRLLPDLPLHGTQHETVYQTPVMPSIRRSGRRADRPRSTASERSQEVRLEQCPARRRRRGSRAADRPEFRHCADHLQPARNLSRAITSNSNSRARAGRSLRPAHLAKSVSLNTSAVNAWTSFPVLPRVAVEPRLHASFFEKALGGPAELRRHLRQQDAALPPLAHDQAVFAGSNLTRARSSSSRESTEISISISASSSGLDRTNRGSSSAAAFAQ